MFNSASNLLPVFHEDQLLEFNSTSNQEKFYVKLSQQNLEAKCECISRDISQRRQSLPCCYSALKASSFTRSFVKLDLRDTGYKCTNGKSLPEYRQSRSSCRDALHMRSHSLPEMTIDRVSDSSETCCVFDLTHLSLTKSFRNELKNQRIFRASDLSQGELLGKGFFGQVFKVTHRQSGEVMVLKELYRFDERAEKNFLKEVAVLHSLKHRNVLAYIGVLYKDQKLHLITEYIGGGTLKDRIHSSNVELTWKCRIEIANDIASGMAYLHHKGIIHRDLNSNNCLVKKDGTVVVGDFGLARILPYKACTEMTKLEKKRRRKKRYTVVGNPYWMAPEMLKGKIYDESVDIFSYGIILCEVIGQVEADPDFMPRTVEFGLNEVAFEDKYCGECPEPFYRIAFLCCSVIPEKRPSFKVIEEWTKKLLFFIASKCPVYESILSEITTFSIKNTTPTDDSTQEVLSPDVFRPPLLRTISETHYSSTSFDDDWSPQKSFQF